MSSLRQAAQASVTYLGKAGGAQMPVAIVDMVFALGAALLVLGAAHGAVPPNSVIGLRTWATQRSEEAWKSQAIGRRCRLLGSRAS